MRRLLVLLALTTTIACESAPADEPEVVVRRDSAGIEIVENLRAALNDSVLARAVGVAPSLEIGELDGDAAYLFDRVLGATRLDDGRVVVANGATNELRFYDADGRHLLTTGGTGGGPAEFEYMLELLRCGADSLYALDTGGTMKVFTSSGDVVRQFRLVEPGSERSSYRRACSSDGRIVLSGWGNLSGPPPIGFHTTRTTVWLVDAEGREIASLGEHLGSERVGYASGGRPTGSGPHPFGRTTELAVGPGVVYLGSGERYEILAYDSTGSVRRIFRAPAEDLSVTPELLADLREQRLASTAPEEHPAVERWLRELPPVENMPAYTKLLVDPAGRVWARRFPLPGQTGERWGVFEPDGRFLGHVTMPARFTTLEIGYDYVLGVARDDADVQFVHLYELADFGAGALRRSGR